MSPRSTLLRDSLLRGRRLIYQSKRRSHSGRNSGGPEAKAAASVRSTNGRTTALLRPARSPSFQQSTTHRPKSTLATSPSYVQRHDEHDEGSHELDASSRSGINFVRQNSRDRHCQTCSCDSKDSHADHRLNSINDPNENSATAGSNSNSDNSPLASRLMEMMKPPYSPSSQYPQQPVPKYSVRRRVLPNHLTSLNSHKGQQILVESLVNQTAVAYAALTIHFANQSDPAFCGITTLLVCLNAFAIDPQTRWRGGWRYFGDEESLLARCCLDPGRIRSEGINLEEFGRLASCQGLRVRTKRATALTEGASTTLLGDLRAKAAATADSSVEDVSGPTVMERRKAGQGVDVSDVRNLRQAPEDSAKVRIGSLEDFRGDIIDALTSSSPTEPNPGSLDCGTAAEASESPRRILVTSFGRKGLKQTGDGHFSPIAAYHAPTDRALVLDVARFKYPPYWVGLEELHSAMTLIDESTQQPRGWFILEKDKELLEPRERASLGGSRDHDDEADADADAGTDGEDRRPARLVPSQQQASWCPMHRVKIDYCKNNNQLTVGNEKGASAFPSAATAATTTTTH